MAAEAIVALAALMLAQLSTMAAAPLIGLTDLLNWLMVHSVDPFTRSGLASTRLPGYSGRLSAINVVYFVPVIAICLVIWKWNPFCFSTITPTKRTALTALIGIQIVFLLLVVFHPFSSTSPDGRLHVSFLDVGQGDSVLVTMPDGTTLLVDGGGRPSFLSKQLSGVSEDETGPDRRSIGEAVVSHFLWSRGLDSVDYLVATHADADHIDGLNDVARNFTVRGALVARSPAEDTEFKKFADTLNSRSIPLTLLGAGDVLRFGNVTAAVLWPLADASNAASSQNNDSLVLRLQYGRRQILLTGDIESGAEAAIVNTYPNMKVDVVKVAHHGSRTSSVEPFVAATRPEFAIISVGRTSIFGHPHSEVVNRWKTAGAEVVTTGESGTITITTDGTDLIVQRFVDEK
jgi:competence protein ComEC